MVWVVGKVWAGWTSIQRPIIYLYDNRVLPAGHVLLCIARRVNASAFMLFVNQTQHINIHRT